MIKAKVIKPFYFAKDKELYLDKDRYEELSKLGYVEKIEEINYNLDNLIHKEKISTNNVEKAIYDKKRILSD